MPQNNDQRGNGQSWDFVRTLQQLLNFIRMINDSTSSVAGIITVIITYLSNSRGQRQESNDHQEHARNTDGNERQGPRP